MAEIHEILTDFKNIIHIEVTRDGGPDENEIERLITKAAKQIEAQIYSLDAEVHALRESNKMRESGLQQQREPLKMLARINDIIHNGGPYDHIVITIIRMIDNNTTIKAALKELEAE